MYADVWARYMSRWVKEYENAGAPIWGITVQNEPEFAAPWEACSFNETTERTFVENHLGPVFRRDNEGVKIIGFDHNKDHAVKWANELKKAGAYIDGIGYHWYAGGMDRLLDGGVGTPNMHRLREVGGARSEGREERSDGWLAGAKRLQIQHTKFLLNVTHNLPLIASLIAGYGGDRTGDGGMPLPEHGVRGGGQKGGVEKSGEKRACLAWGLSCWERGEYRVEFDT